MRANKNKYIFPAKLVYEKGKEIAITFPDLNVGSCGKTEEEALMMGKEVLGLHLCGMEEDGIKIPEPSKLKDIKCKSNEVKCLVEVVMPVARFANKERAITKTVTIPNWLNAIAVEHNVNFSGILQEALVKVLSGSMPASFSTKYLNKRIKKLTKMKKQGD